MPTVTLDTNTVRTATCPEGQRKLDLYDTTIPGFVLEVRPSGGKTWYLRYRDARGKQHQHRIGDAAGITFEQARTAAQTTRAKVILGENPAEEKKALRQIPTLEAFALERYLPYVQGYKRAWKCDETWLRVHILPRFGQRHLDEITQGEVIAFQHAKRAEGYKPATVNRFIILLSVRSAKPENEAAVSERVSRLEHGPAAGGAGGRPDARSAALDGQLSGELRPQPLRGAENFGPHPAENDPALCPFVSRDLAGGGGQPGRGGGLEPGRSLTTRTRTSPWWRCPASSACGVIFLATHALPDGQWRSRARFG